MQIRAKGTHYGVLSPFIIYVFLLLTALPSAAQVWTPKTKLGESAISDIRFQDKDTGYILSYSKVFRTTDAGETWSRILNTYSKFNRCFFADQKHGWIIGENDLVLKTTNGGVSWSLCRTGQSAVDPSTIYAKDKDTVYMIAAEDMDTYKYGKFFYRSYDGGSNWSRVSTGSTQTMRGLYHWTEASSEPLPQAFSGHKTVGRHPQPILQAHR